MPCWNESASYMQSNVVNALAYIILLAINLNLQIWKKEAFKRLKHNHWILGEENESSFLKREAYVHENFFLFILQI